MDIIIDFLCQRLILIEINLYLICTDIYNLIETNLYLIGTDIYLDVRGLLDSRLYIVSTVLFLIGTDLHLDFEVSLDLAILGPRYHVKNRGKDLCVDCWTLDFTS